MMARVAKARRSGCPISVALDQFGDSWTLLVVRDLMFKGATTFRDFECGGEGIATNILSDRLSRLDEHGLVEKLKDPNDARRFVYQLTEKGMDLAPMMVELILWAARHEDTAAPPALIRRMRNDRDGFMASLRAEWAQRRRPHAKG